MARSIKDTIGVYNDIKRQLHLRQTELRLCEEEIIKGLAAERQFDSLKVNWPVLRNTVRFEEGST